MMPAGSVVSAVHSLPSRTKKFVDCARCTIDVRELVAFSAICLCGETTQSAPIGSPAASNAPLSTIDDQNSAKCGT